MTAYNAAAVAAAFAAATDGADWTEAYTGSNAYIDFTATTVGNKATLITSFAAAAAPTAPTVVSTDGSTPTSVGSNEVWLISFTDTANPNTGSITFDGKTYTPASNSINAAGFKTAYDTGTGQNWTVTVTGTTTASLSYKTQQDVVDANVVLSANTITNGTATLAKVSDGATQLGGGTETAVVTFQPLKDGQAVTVAGRVVTATGGDLTAAQVASAMSTGTTSGSAVVSGSLAGWTLSGLSSASLTYTSTTPNADVAPPSVSVTNSPLTATSPTVAETTPGAEGSGILVLDNFATGGTFELTGSINGASQINVKDAATNAADVLNIKLNGASNIVNTAALSVANVETINIVTDANTSDADSLVLVDAAATTITVSGGAGLNLTFAGTKLTSFDASGVTKGVVALTTGALEAAATIKGGNDDNDITFSAATKAVTFTGGAGADVVYADNANANVINTGGGIDNVFLGNGNNTVDLGAGTDTITLGRGLNIVTLGAGNDTVIVSDTANGNVYTTIADIATGDTISFTAVFDTAVVGAGTAGKQGSQIILADTAAFADFLNAGAAGTQDSVSWFQYAGNTYVVANDDSAVTFQNGTDAVIKLAGVVDLSSSILVDAVLTIV